MSIRNELDRIKSAVYGREVRDSIHDAIEQAYDDASENGNANMEVRLARGTHSNLNDRLDDMQEADSEITAQLAQKANQSDLDIERQRINAIIDLPEGSTTGDASLADIKVGADGKVYNTPGEAVRENDKKLNEAITVLTGSERVSVSWELGSLNVQTGGVGSPGDATRIRSQYLKVNLGASISVNNPDIEYAIYEYSLEGKFLSSVESPTLLEWKSGTSYFNDRKYIRILIRYKDGRDISEDEIDWLGDNVVFKSVDMPKVTPADITSILESYKKAIIIPGDSFNWELGTLDINSGAPGTPGNTTRIRSEFIDVLGKSELVFDNTTLYEYRIFFYNEDNSYVGEVTEYASHDYVIEEKCRIKILIRYKENQDISYSEMNNLAKALKIVTPFQTFAPTTQDISWELGTLDINSGVPGTPGDTTRIRSEFIDFPNGGLVNFSNVGGVYKYRAFFYNEHKEYETLTDYRKTALYINPNTSIKLLVAYNDDRGIMPGEVASISELVSVVSFQSEVSGDKIPNRANDYILSGELKGYYEATDPFNFADPENIQHTDIYGKYDELMNEYPHYIKKYDRGSVEGGLPMYYYTFIPREENVHLGNPRPKIIITTGTHGDEKTPPVATISFFQELCRNWRSSGFLEFLRHNIEFVVIPVVNPTGINANTRHNINAVDPNRTYPKTSNPEDATQLSTKTVMEILAEHADAEILIDFHNMWWKNGGQVNYAFVDGEITTRAIANAMMKVNREWQKRFEFMPQDEDKELTYTIPLVNSMLAAYAARKGMRSLLLEIPRDMRYESPDFYTDTNMLMGEELLANSIKGMLKTLNIITT